MENLSLRLFKIISEFQDYNITVTWSAGKCHLFCDSLGRIPQIDSWTGFDPLNGQCQDTVHCNIAECSEHHTVNNVTHLDPVLGIQVTLSL